MRIPELCPVVMLVKQFTNTVVDPSASRVPTSQLQAALKFLPDDGAGTRAFFSQTIADFAYGCDISPVLSERMTPQYILQHMGGLEGSYGMEESDFDGVEAYNIVFGEEDAEFVVDRRSIFDSDLTKKDYMAMGKENQDDVLITKAARQWFKKNIFLKGRIPGADTKFVDDVVESAIKDIGLGPLLKYGILHSCVPIPGAGTQGKPMYIEWHAQVTNMEMRDVTTMPLPRYPYYHIWEHEELRFRMEDMTYSNQSYLTVHMPGYC